MIYLEPISGFEEKKAPALITALPSVISPVPPPLAPPPVVTPIPPPPPVEEVVPVVRPPIAPPPVEYIVEEAPEEVSPEVFGDPAVESVGKYLILGLVGYLVFRKILRII